MRLFSVQRSNAGRGGFRCARAALAGTVLACWLNPAPATGQSIGSCTPDTSTVVKRLVLGLSADSEPDSAGRALTATVAVQIASFVEQPTRLTIDKVRGPDERRDPSGTYRSEGLLSIGQLALDLSPTGHLQRLTLDPGTGSPEVDHALVAGAAAADSGGVFPPAANGARGPRHIRLWLLTATKPPPTWAAPLFLVAGRMPANATPAIVQSQPAPSYPQALLPKGVEGEAYLAFEVDEQGHVAESSIQVLSADDPAFVEPAKQSVREAHFVAATQGGCPVRATLLQRVRFRATAPASVAGTAASGPASAPTPNPADKDAVVAEEARWLAANLPKLASAQVLLQVDAHIGGTDVASGRTWVRHAKLDHCTLIIDRVFDVVGTDPVAPVPKQHLSQWVPLDHVDPRSLAVQQTPLRGPGVGFVGGEPWRLVLSLADGSIRSERDRTSSNDSELDLFVSNREAGLQIATHLQAAIMACR